MMTTEIAVIIFKFRLEATYKKTQKIQGNDHNVALLSHKFHGI